MMDVGNGQWVQGVDNLAQILNQRLTLEGTVLSQRARELRGEAIKLARQRAFLRDERRRARMEEESLRQDKVEFQHLRKSDWLPVAYLPGPEIKRVRLNVGGQVFEASETVLRRDPHSMLAALCDDECPLKTDDDGIVYVDRDWWTFRFVLKFLRDGVLPSDKPLLAQLYREASYWRLKAMQRAIEEERLQLYRSEYEVDENGKVTARTKPGGNKNFWSTMPNWWDSQQRVTPGQALLSVEEKAAYDVLKAKEAERKAQQAPHDWWVGTEYKGHKFVRPPEKDKSKNSKPATATDNSRGGIFDEEYDSKKAKEKDKKTKDGVDELPLLLTTTTWSYSGTGGPSRGRSIW